MTKKHLSILVIVISIFISADSLPAQVKNFVYSIFGVGQVVDNSFGINKSLAGTGIAFQSGRSINHSNPASYLGVLPNSITTEVGFYGISSRSASKYTSQTEYDAKVSYLATSLYLKRWWAFNFGIFPYSYVNYDITSTDQIEGEPTSFEINFCGSGGLNRISFGNSFKLPKGLSIGCNPSFIFGDITQMETALSNDNFIGYEISNERKVLRFYMDYGMQYSVTDNQWVYTLGMIYGASKALNSTDDYEFTYNGETSSLGRERQLDYKIPQKFGLGLAIQKNENFRVGFDYEWQNWSGIDFSNPYFETRNSQRFSTGVEFSPNRGGNWLKSLYYRLGANYKNSYFEIHNTPINSFGITVGFGIPYKEANIFNFSLEYGEEGTLRKGLIKNSYWALCLNFSFHEFWSKGSRQE